jgi:hypothetical protein
MSTADSAANVVNTWFSERLASGALARDTPAYNQVVSALPDLISRLAPLLFRIRWRKAHRTKPRPLSSPARPDPFPVLTG